VWVCPLLSWRSSFIFHFLSFGWVVPCSALPPRPFSGLLLLLLLLRVRLGTSRCSCVEIAPLLCIQASFLRDGSVAMWNSLLLVWSCVLFLNMAPSCVFVMVLQRLCFPVATVVVYNVVLASFVSLFSPYFFFSLLDSSRH